MKKSKLLLTLLMASLMATTTAGLAACGKKDDGGSGTNTEQGGGNTNQGDNNQGDDNQEDENQGGNTGDNQGGSTGDNQGGNQGDNNQGDNEGGNQGGGDNTGDNTGDDNEGGNQGGSTGGDNTGDDNTGDDNTGDDNTGDDNTGDDNTGDDNTGDDNTGDDNTGDDETLTGPVITIDGNPTVIELGLGEELTVPSATAVDAVDGAVDVEIFCETTKGAYNNKTGVFKTDILGDHILTYYAYDSNDNETFEDVIIRVVSDTYQETADVTGYNDLANLKGSSGTFKENFEKGWESPLIKKASLPDVAVKAGAQSINGNSLVINYYELEALENRVFMNTLPIRDGIWTLSFDVKLIEGVADSDFYVGYVKEGEVDSKDQQFSLAGMQVGEVRRIEYKQLLNLDEGGQYYFHFFEHMRDMQAILAFDNFEVTYQEAPSYNEVAPTFDQLKAGFTYDWANNYMSVTSGMPEVVSNIENAQAKAAIEGASSGFASSVMHLTGNGAHDLGGIMKEKDPTLFQEGWTYIFEIDYYAVSVGSTYIIAYDGTPSNRMVKNGLFNVGLNKVMVEYTVGANDKALTFYGEMDVYVGNIKITAKEPVVQRKDFHSVTHAEMKAEGGYTYDWSENNIIDLSANTKYEEIDKMENTTLKDALIATNAFTNGYAMKFAGASSSYINCLNGMLVAGNKYTVSFDAYVVTPGSITVLLMDEGAAQAGQANFTVTDNSNGTKKYTATFTAASNYAKVNLYVISECELYLANFTLIEKEPSAESVEHTNTGTKVWHQLNNFGKGTQVETPDGAKGQDGFADDYTLLLTATGGEMVAELFQAGSLVPSGHDFKSISLTFKYYIPEDFSGSGLYIKVDGAFQPITATPGYHTATYTSTTAADYVCIYTSTGTSGNVYLGSVDYTVVTTAEA